MNHIKEPELAALCCYVAIIVLGAIFMLAWCGK